jgi:gamma-tubulin complex component 4
LLNSFYEQLTISTSPQQLALGVDASRTGISNVSMTNYTTFNMSKVMKSDGGMADVRRHIERLLLRLDFNGRFSDPRWKKEGVRSRVLAEGGLA